MCLVLFAYDAHPRYRLVLAANRDELYARPTAPAAFWDDAPELLAGRDLREGGTWLGVTRGGRFAAVTNFRDPAAQRPGAPSRGALVAGYLRSRGGPLEYLAGLAPLASAYNGFNLLVGDGRSLAWFSNRHPAFRILPPGVYGLSNHLLDTPWPKVARGKADLRQALEGPPDELEASLFATLALRDPAPDAALPETGVGAELERALSAAFIVTPEYGTRSSTVLLIGRDGGVSLVERTGAGGAEGTTEVRHRFPLDGPAW